MKLMVVREFVGPLMLVEEPREWKIGYVLCIHLTSKRKVRLP